MENMIISCDVEKTKETMEPPAKWDSEHRQMKGLGSSMNTEPWEEAEYCEMLLIPGARQTGGGRLR